MTHGSYLDAFHLDDHEYMPVLEVVAEQSLRKIEYNLGHRDVPEPLVHLGHTVTSHLDAQPNTVITKSYDNRDGYVSKAYFPHRDPERFVGRMAVVSLNSFAQMFLELNGQIIAIPCRAGRLVVADSSIIHWITPPLEGAVRRIVFYGCDSSKLTR